MSRPLSLAALISAFAQETNEAWIALLTIDHAELDEPMRFALNGEDITSRGEVFTASWFDVLLPDDTADRPSQAQITFPNVAREMTALLELSLTPPTMVIELILASYPDDVQISWPAMMLQQGTKYNAESVTGPLAGKRMLRETYPKGVISPAYFPGAF